MNIDTQQMEEYLRIQVQPSTQTPRQVPSPSAPHSFDSILNEAISAQDIAQSPTIGTLLPHGAGSSEMISQMLLQNVGGEPEAYDQRDLLENTFNNASGTLDLWDTYAKKLGSSQNTDLREAYSILESIGNQVEQLKSNASNLNTPNFGLNSFINEMDIMATTEKIKFNRGDYV